MLPENHSCEKTDANKSSTWVKKYIQFPLPEQYSTSQKIFELSSYQANDRSHISKQQASRIQPLLNMVRPLPKIALLSVFALLTFPPLSGRPRSLNLHPRRQSRSLPTISPHPPLPNRRPSSFFPQTCRLLHSAHDGRSRQRPLRLPTARRTFPSSYHESAIKHLARH